MKKLHQRSMKLAALPCMIALVLTMSGCTLQNAEKGPDRLSQRQRKDGCAFRTQITGNDLA